LLGRPKIQRNPPFVDTFHFAGGRKPWREPIKAALIPTSFNSSSAARDVWRYWLGLANRTFGLELPPLIIISTAYAAGGFVKFDYDQLLRPGIELPIPSSELR
jgi:hypothetical protein